MIAFPLLVMDASAALALVFADEEGGEMEHLLRGIIEQNGQIFVPELFWYEFHNGILSAERRGRISREKSVVVSADIARLPIVSVSGAEEPLMTDTMELARKHDLTFCSASYLELAKRNRASLKSFDNHLLALKNQYPCIL